MKIYENIKQGTQEWLDLRKPVFTASDMDSWISQGDKPSQYQKEKREAAILKKVAIRLGYDVEDPNANKKSYWMQRGNDLEPDARAQYESLSGNSVEEVGFVMHNSGVFGCSPDGFVDGRKGMVEFKCPAPQTHLKYVLSGKLPAQYKIQVHMQMAVCEAEYVDFMSYLPNYGEMLVHVKRDDFTEKVLEGLLLLEKDFTEMYEKLKNRSK